MNKCLDQLKTKKEFNIVRKSLLHLGLISVFFVSYGAVAVELPSFSGSEQIVRIPQITVNDTNLLYDVELHLDFDSGKFLVRKYSDDAPTDIAELNLPFKLALGKTANINGTDLQFQFSDVTDDSRCPSDAVCVWPGQVVAVINVIRAGKAAEKITLTSPNAYPIVHELSGYKLELLGVQPYPLTSTAIKKQDYRVILRVTPLL
ncbi:MAG: hypothetical protein JSR71_13625 [Proteobacteria bacterium]|nr:hypothetical protein [Pseudomonadota bacterium]